MSTITTSSMTLTQDEALIRSRGTFLTPPCKSCASRKLPCLRWDDPSSPSTKCGSCHRYGFICSRNKFNEASETEPYSPTKRIKRGPSSTENIPAAGNKQIAPIAPMAPSLKVTFPKKSTSPKTPSSPTATAPRTPISPISPIMGVAKLNQLVMRLQEDMKRVKEETTGNATVDEAAFIGRLAAVEAQMARLKKENDRLRKEVDELKQAIMRIS